MSFFEYGRHRYKVNTFIGGIGTTINTAALLSAKLGVSESRIKLFEVVGSDVRCSITGSYGSSGTWFQGQSATNNNAGITSFDDKDGLVTSLIDGAFYANQQNMLITKIFFKNCTYIGDYCFYDYANRSYIQEIILPKCVQVIGPTGRHFCGLKKLKRVYIPLVNTLGNTIGDNEIFLNSNPSCVIYANPFLQTCNAGSPDGDLQYASSLGMSVRYVTNFTPSAAVNDLSAGTIYNSVVQLNFTPPSSANGVDFYEVYVNGVFKNEIKNSGDFVLGLIKNTNYNIEIIAVDNLYNKSEFSNIINVTTGNNALDTDAESYINASDNQIHETAIDNLFKSLKTANLYNKIHAFYPFLGTTATQHKWNAKNPADTNTAFRLVFTGGGTFDYNGYQTNGSNAYANTFLTPSTNMNYLSIGITLTSGTNNIPVTTNTLDMGCEQTTPFPAVELALRRHTSKLDVTAMLGIFNTTVTNGGYIEEVNVSDIRGCNTVCSIGTTLRKLYRNGLLKVTQSTGTITSQLPTIPIYIGCLNNGGSAFGYSNQRFQLTAIHEGLSDSEVATLHSIINTFESAIGRKTW